MRANMWPFASKEERDEAREDDRPVHITQEEYLAEYEEIEVEIEHLIRKQRKLSEAYYAQDGDDVD